MSSQPGKNAINDEQAFYFAFYRRLMGTMALLAVTGMSLAWYRYNRFTAFTFAAGSLIAILNFHWLRRTIEAMGAGLEATGKKPGSAGVVLRFLLRYVLIAAAAYAIVRGTANSFYGLLAGLSLPVGAILIEAMRETYRALRQGL